MSKENGFTIWLTGPSGSGKTYLSNGLKEKLTGMGRYVEILDGDSVRKKLYPDIGFSKEAREMHNRVVINTAKLLTKYGVATIVALISPYSQVRNYARDEIGKFVEVYVDSTMEVRIERDPKGLYSRAIKGEITNLTGYDGTYEAPENPEAVVRSHEMTLDEEVDVVISKVKELGYL